MIRIIAHLDMDAFFASVEERDKPWLRGRPIVIGADPKNGKGRGVVSTANYPARRFGIHSAMPISRAWKLADEARQKGAAETVFILPDIKRYSEESVRIMEVIKRYSPSIEQVSVDEAFFDLSNAGSFVKAEMIGKKIKEEIRSKEKLTASIGIAPNKLIAKIASDMEKPDGLTVIGVDEEEECRKMAERFMEGLSLRKIPGVGPKTEQVFLTMGLRTVKDLKRFGQKELVEMLGKFGLDLYKKLRGIDDSPLVEYEEPKSIGEQETFMRDTLDRSFIIERLKALCEGVIGRLREEEFASFNRIVVTIRFSDFLTRTKSRSLKESLNKVEDLYFEAMNLIMPFLDKRENSKMRQIRLIGVRVEGLSR